MNAPATPPAPLRLATLAWALLAAGVTLRVALAPASSGSVFPVYTTAAESWLAGDDLYTLDFSKPCFRYHPLVAASFVPWLALPYKVAAILWRWLGIVLLLAGLGAWLRHLAPRPATPARRGWLLLLVVPLALQSINNAQVNSHLLGLLLLGLAAAARERWTLAAALITTATVFKLYPVAVGLLLVVVHPRPFAPRFALMLLLAAALPFLARDPEYVARQYQVWFDYLQSDHRAAGAVEQAPRDLYLLLRVWVGPPPESAYRFLQAGSAGILALGCWALRRRGVPDKTVLAAVLNLGCVWMTLLGPATESSTYTLLGATAAGLLVFADPARPRGVSRLAALGYGLLVLPTVAAMFPGGTRLQVFGVQPAGAICLLAVLADDFRRSFAAAPVNCDAEGFPSGARLRET
jgi:hypothetical protein